MVDKKMIFCRDRLQPVPFFVDPDKMIQLIWLLLISRGRSRLARQECKKQIIVFIKIMENKICHLCNSQFIVTDDDLKFYEKVSPEFAGRKYLIPSPTLCPTCREQRRLCWRNERKLYKRKCHLCGKEMVSIYAPDKDYKVCCAACFWSDQWDPVDVGRDYDFGQPFFEQLNKLINESKLLGLLGTNNENSDFVNHESDSKNCYLNVGGHFNQDCYYNTYSFNGKNNIDNYWIWYCENLYNSLNCAKCFNSSYLNDCAGCTDYHFCQDCLECKNCFASANLSHKEYYFFNQLFTPEEYYKKIDEYLTTQSGIEKAKIEANSHLNKFRYKFADLIFCENCTGDHLKGCHDVEHGFYCERTENCKNINISTEVKDSHDIDSLGWSELNYQICSAYQIPRSGFGAHLVACQDCWYSFANFNSQNLFGCVGLNHKQYCILNKQYTKEEYEKLVPKIIEQMKVDGEWGEFFPMAISPFGYNETVAMEYYPLNKEKAKELGAKWQEEDFGIKYTGPFYEPKDISFYNPKTNPEAEKEIEECKKGILKCEVTGRPFRVLPQELAQYIEKNIQLPRRHPDQRHLDRMAKLNPRQLWHRQCMCENQLTINNEQLTGETECRHQGRCTNEFETTYAPDRPEKVYCEECYRKSVI